MASKKLYIELAKTINRHVKSGGEKEHQTIRYLVQDLCDDFKQDNIRFNRDKFMEACGL